jgi:hypothetical protein
MNATSEYTSDSLRQILGDLVRTQITVFLTVWLAFVVPITCQHHLIMGWLDSALDEHLSLEHEGHSAHHQQTHNEISCIFHDHEIPVNDTMILSLVLALVPEQLSLYSPTHKGVLVAEALLFSRQRAFMPAKPPPRPL